VSGSTSKWFKVLVHEGSTFISGLSFRATLDSPPGMDFDLYAYLGDSQGPNCFASPLHASGSPEALSDSWSDTVGFDDSTWYALEVRFVSGADCTAKWTLTVEGDTP
jgi:hypothetical protein